MPRLLAGPCLSVTFPAPSSIFLTSPSMASCAATAVASKAAESAVATECISLLNFIFFPFDRLKFGSGHLISLIAVRQSPFTCLHPFHVHSLHALHLRRRSLILGTALAVRFFRRR